MSIPESSTLQTNLQMARRERRARRLWVSIICGFFAIDFSIAAIAITMAAGDPSFRSIPGYGERAVAWDVRQQRKQASKDLGWKIELTRAEPLRDAIHLTIKDSLDQPVIGCTGAVRLFHYTRVAQQLRSEWVEQEPGHYVALVDVSKPGLWQMELELRGTSDQRFWSEQSLDWSKTADEATATR